MIEQLVFRFSGRYGNNIIQLANALHIHLNRPNSFLDIPNTRRNNINPKIIDKHRVYHNLFKNNIDLIFLSNEAQLFYKKCYISNIYYWKKSSRPYYGIKYMTFEDRIAQLDILVNEVLELKDTPYIPDTDLLIHVRSTDIYKAEPHKSYAQPPISFYNKVIEDSKCNNIYILSDDNKNFVVEYLQKTYRPKTILVEEPDAKKAYNILRNTKNVCTSTSSFCTTATLLKPKNQTKNIFTYEYLCYKPGVWHYDVMFDSILKRPSYNFHIYKINNYVFMTKNNNEFIGNWTFTTETKNIMKNHNISNIIKLSDHEFR
jgi:hypothetical protein